MGNPDDLDLVCVASFTSLGEADIFHAALESHGIEARIDEDLVMSVLRHMARLGGDARVLVQEADVPKVAKLFPQFIRTDVIPPEKPGQLLSLDESLPPVRDSNPPQLRCPCGEPHIAGFDVCWRCKTARTDLQGLPSQHPSAEEKGDEKESQTIPGDEPGQDNHDPNGLQPICTCGEPLLPEFDVCWACGTDRAELKDRPLSRPVSVEEDEDEEPSLFEQLRFTITPDSDFPDPLFGPLTERVIVPVANGVFSRINRLFCLPIVGRLLHLLLVVILSAEIVQLTRWRASVELAHSQIVFYWIFVAILIMSLLAAIGLCFVARRSKDKDFLASHRSGEADESGGTALSNEQRSTQTADIRRAGLAFLFGLAIGIGPIGLALGIYTLYESGASIKSPDPIIRRWTFRMLNLGVFVMLPAWIMLLIAWGQIQ